MAVFVFLSVAVACFAFYRKLSSHEQKRQSPSRSELLEQVRAKGPGRRLRYLRNDIDESSKRFFHSTSPLSPEKKAGMIYNENGARHLVNQLRHGTPTEKAYATLVLEEDADYVFSKSDRQSVPNPQSSPIGLTGVETSNTEKPDLVASGEAKSESRVRHFCQSPSDEVLGEVTTVLYMPIPELDKALYLCQRIYNSKPGSYAEKEMRESKPARQKMIVAAVIYDAERFLENNPPDANKQTPLSSLFPSPTPREDNGLAAAAKITSKSYDVVTFHAADMDWKEAFVGVAEIVNDSLAACGHPPIPDEVVAHLMACAFDGERGCLAAFSFGLFWINADDDEREALRDSRVLSRASAEIITSVPKSSRRYVQFRDPEILSRQLLPLVDGEGGQEIDLLLHEARYWD